VAFRTVAPNHVDPALIEHGRGSPHLPTRCRA